jgi:hypothetical protein
MGLQRTAGLVPDRRPVHRVHRPVEPRPRHPVIRVPIPRRADRASTRIHDWPWGRVDVNHDGTDDIIAKVSGQVSDDHVYMVLACRGTSTGNTPLLLSVESRLL